MLLALLGCQPIDLAEEWELDRLRLLAVRAEPAEPAPGDTVTFTSLRFVPDGADWTAIWFACADGDDEGCALDEDLLAALEGFEEMSAEEQAEALAALQAAGFAGVEPGMTPTWLVPEDALDALTEAEQLEGLGATVQATLATETDTELVLKRIPVSRATTPNTNPDVLSLSADDVALESTLVVDAGASVSLVATSDLETYTYVTTDGVAEERVEELEWRWYTSGGELARAFSLGGDDDTSRSEATWVAPDEAGACELDVVVLDGRGGMGWWQVSVEVR